MEVELIKDRSLIISETVNSSGNSDFVLKNHVKLSEVFNFLPKGIINKRETGIGATTLELKSKRHSIIIEPLKATVVQKALSNKDIYPYLVDNPNVSSELEKYLLNDKYEFKKIILVIDNLERLASELGDYILNYFLLFDEIDFMQGSSSYRQKMEFGLDIGKSHGNFALVSATVINFSDPELLDVPRTSFSYENTEPGTVHVHHVSTPALSAIQKRNTLLNKLNGYIIHNIINNNDKILIALNSVKFIDKVASFLVNENYIKKEDITLLISDNKYTNNIIRDKYSKLSISEETLPTRVTFITSAYFNGYDLNDDYRLAIFSSPPINNTMLTMNEIKQIYGRNRRIGGVVECTLFSHDCMEEDIQELDLVDFTIDDWLEYASTQVDVANCIDKHFTKVYRTPKANNAMELFYNKFTENNAKNHYVLSRKKKPIDKNNFCESLLNKHFIKHTNTIAYYQVDYLFYQFQNLQSIYLNNASNIFDDESVYMNSDYKVIENLNIYGFSAQVSTLEFKDVKLVKETKTQKQEIAEIVEFILDKKKAGLIDTYQLDKNQALVNKTIELAQKTFSTKSSINQILSLASFQQVSNLFEYLTLYAESKNHILIRQIKHYFKVNQHYTSDEIINQVETIYKELNKPLKSPVKLKQARVFISLVYDLKSTSFRRKGALISGYVAKAAKKYTILKKK